MGYYQGSNNVYSKFDKPHFEMMPYPINYNQGGHDGTAGFGNDGDCTITAESPGNKGFEAPYWSANQWNSYSNTQNSRVNATGNAYMYFGNQYNKGPISNRGGLLDGWGAVAGGKIFKISKTGGSTSWTSGIMMYARNEVKYVKHHIMRFRAYIWISSGFGSSSKTLRVGIMDSLSSFSVPSLDDWYYVDHVFGTSDVLSPDIRLNLGSDSGGGTREVWMAHPCTYAMTLSSGWNDENKAYDDTINMSSACFMGLLGSSASHGQD
tara:strand:+ start:42 stop:836 length:795 start_codon:yes stop_codon:yes gene_type:complete